MAEVENYKNKAFSLIELLIAIVISSIVMLVVYVMLVLAYKQFYDLTDASQYFNNLSVFERTFQRSAMNCSYYSIQTTGGNFIITFLNSNMKQYEIYRFEDLKNLEKIDYKTTIKKKNEYYLNDISKDNSDTTCKVYYTTKSTGTFSYPAGYMGKLDFKPTTTDKDKVLLDNIVKVYYEISSDLTSSNFTTKLGIGTTWERHSNYSKIYSPFIRLIIIYKDPKNNLRRTYLTFRLRNIEGTLMQY